MEKAPENGKESSHYAHKNGTNELRRYFSTHSLHSVDAVMF
jgi:hypothetical protein